jgi:hypothetical protein
MRAIEKGERKKNNIKLVVQLSMQKFFFVAVAFIEK